MVSMVLRAPEMTRSVPGLSGSRFSCSLLGRVFDQIRSREEQGLEVSAAVLEDLTPDEAAHIAGILQRQDNPVSQQALSDCANTILTENQLASMNPSEDLMALRQKLKERKGINP